MTPVSGLRVPPKAEDHMQVVAPRGQTMVMLYLCIMMFNSSVPTQSRCSGAVQHAKPDPARVAEKDVYTACLDLCTVVPKH